MAKSLNTRILIPSGVLGLGFDSDALARGVAAAPDAICIDGGSTDSGPFYLGTGTSKYSELATKAEWRELMLARAEAGVPLILGSCGTCGTAQTVDWMFEMTLELARELGQDLKIARLYSDQSVIDLIAANEDQRIRPLLPETPLDAGVLNRCSHIVALAGVEQITAALDAGADIVLAGRTTDTAVIAALPLARGAAPGAAWHGAKIGECGALCSTHPVSGVIQIDFDEEGFTVQPLAEGAKCTPHSVIAHMLYENANPLELVEPGGTLDVKTASVEAIDAKTVRVTGSNWIPAAHYTVKLEGAAISGYQTSSLVLIRQKEYVEKAQQWCDLLEAYLRKSIETKMELKASDYDIDFRLIGINATLGALETRDSQPAEVGVLMLVTSHTQSQATDIARLCNPFLLHFPLTKTEPLPTFAFPYSPAESERGAVYEFVLNHVLALADPMQAFELRIEETVNGRIVKSR